MQINVSKHGITITDIRFNSRIFVWIGKTQNNNSFSYLRDDVIDGHLNESGEESDETHYAKTDGRGDFLELWEHKTWKTNILHKNHKRLKFDVPVGFGAPFHQPNRVCGEFTCRPRKLYYLIDFRSPQRIIQTSSNAQRTISKTFVTVVLTATKCDERGPMCDLHTHLSVQVAYMLLI